MATELQLISWTTGISDRELRKAWPAHQIQALEAVPMHLWRSKQMFQIEGQPGLKVVSPFVLVQKMPHQQMSQLMELGLERSAETESASDLASSAAESLEENSPSIESLERLYRGDQTGVILSSLLSMEMTGGSLGKATNAVERNPQGGQRCLRASGDRP